MEYAIYIYTFTVIGAIYQYIWEIIAVVLFGLYLHLNQRIK